jgi:mortality factor 4-like protein 1
VLTFGSWDDWVPEDRLRKLSPENRELANNLRHEMLAQQRAARAQPQPVKKKAQGSARGSEERQTSVTAPPRGQKRMRDNDLEKVSVPAHMKRSRCCSTPSNLVSFQ